MDPESHPDATGVPGARHQAYSRQLALLDVILALVLTLVAGLTAASFGQRLSDQLQLPMLPVLALQGAVILAGIGLLLRLRGLGWRDLALGRPRLLDLARAPLALILILLMNGLLMVAVLQFNPSLIESHQERLSGVAGFLAQDLPLPLIAFAMLIVGFYEELLARGFILQRSRVLLSGYWGPVLLSALLFGLGHFYQGWLGVAQTSLMGLLLAALTLRWQSLWPAILAHAAVNTLSFAVLREFAAS